MLALNYYPFSIKIIKSLKRSRPRAYNLGENRNNVIITSGVFGFEAVNVDDDR